TRATFVTAIDRMSRYREDQPFDSWLYAIAVEVSRRRYRRWRILRWLQKITGGARSTFYTPAEQSAPETASGDLSDAALWKAVRVLPERLRLAVVLRYYHEMTVPEIAPVLRIS